MEFSGCIIKYKNILDGFLCLVATLTIIFVFSAKILFYISVTVDRNLPPHFFGSKMFKCYKLSQIFHVPQLE